MKKVCFFIANSLKKAIFTKSKRLNPEKGGIMDRNVTLYQITSGMAEKVFQKIENFNRGRREDTGFYAISVSTPYRYYALWRIFADTTQSPLFIRTLAVTFDDAADRAFQYLQNCNVMLKVKDNSFFESFYGLSDDIISFGKYNGKRLADVYYVDPHYVLWLAHKFDPRNPRDKRLAVVAKSFATVHYETVIRKHNLPGGSRFIGQPGEKLSDLNLMVLGVRLQLDSYKTRGYHVDQSVLAADVDGNRYTFVIKAAAASMTPETLSCYSKKINPRESIYIKSAKVLSHYESKGVKCTRIGYLKFK